MSKDDANELEQFKTEAAGTSEYTVVIITNHQLNAEIEAANRGDKNAQYNMLCFMDWQQKAQTRTPYCFVCGEEVVPVFQGGDGIGGFALIRPTSADSHISMNGVFCIKCKGHGYKRISESLKHELQRQFDCEIEDVKLQ